MEVFLDSYCEVGCLAAMISIAIASWHLLDCLKLCSTRRLHLKYCARTAIMVSSFQVHVISPNSFESNAVLDFDSRLAMIGTLQMASLVVLVRLALQLNA